MIRFGKLRRAEHPHVAQTVRRAGLDNIDLALRLEVPLGVVNKRMQAVVLNPSARYMLRATDAWGLYRLDSFDTDPDPDVPQIAPKPNGRREE